MRMELKWALIALLLAGSLFAYLSEGFSSRGSLPFHLSYGTMLIIATWCMAGMEGRSLLVLSLSSILLGALVESVNTAAGNWEYLGGIRAPLFVIIGWVFMMAVIISVSRFGMQLVKPGKPDSLRFLPVLACIMLFLVSLWAGGYLPFLTVTILVVYAGLSIAGIFYARYHSLRWSLLVVLAACIIVACSEFMGAWSHLWGYRFSELLPPFLVFAWALNAGGVLALAQLAGIDFEQGGYQGAPVPGSRTGEAPP
jgi:hypothetical protein